MNQDNKQPSAVQLHKVLGGLQVYKWHEIDDIPFKNGIYIVFEEGEIYNGFKRIVRVGTHTGQNRLKKRLKIHFIQEDQYSSIFRKNIGKAMLNRDQDPLLAKWTLSREKASKLGAEDKKKIKCVESRVSDYMRGVFTFCVFRVESKDERLRFEEAIIATLNQAEDFKDSISDKWLGNSSPEKKISQSGMWLKQGLNAKPLTNDEMIRLTELIRSTF